MHYRLRIIAMISISTLVQAAPCPLQDSIQKSLTEISEKIAKLKENIAHIQDKDGSITGELVNAVKRNFKDVAESL